ncbi:MAG: hypothetical protein IPF93_08940 [Saprospiraceae bacterium]|nr:hypothetical protein [Saprospiraceae bacterium]
MEHLQSALFDIVVENNRIKSVTQVGYPGIAIDSAGRPKLLPGGKEIQAEGQYVLPGFVEMHGHIEAMRRG